MPFVKSITAGYVLFCVPKENQKSTRYSVSYTHLCTGFLFLFEGQGISAQKVEAHNDHAPHHQHNTGGTVQGLGAVSYTHLDVYKRQAEGCADGRCY